MNQHHDLKKVPIKGVKSYEKGIKMEAKIDAKSIRNRVCDKEINETGTENGIKNHEKGTKIESKSLRNQSCEADAFWDRFWRPKPSKI